MPSHRSGLLHLAHLCLGQLSLAYSPFSHSTCFLFAERCHWSPQGPQPQPLGGTKAQSPFFLQSRFLSEG